jgi:glycosidase
MREKIYQSKNNMDIKDLAYTPELKKYQDYFPFGIQVNRKSWTTYDVHSVLAEAEKAGGECRVYGLRLLSEKMNALKRPAPVSPGKLMTMSLILEALRLLLRKYYQEQCPGVLPDGLKWVSRRRGAEVVERTVENFVQYFPPQVVQRGLLTEHEYLAYRTEGVPNRVAAIPELILLYLTNSNPAMAIFRDLFDDSDLRKASPYLQMLTSLEEYFDTQPLAMFGGMTLFKALRAPFEQSPDSLEGQLEFLLQKWSMFLPEEMRRRLLVGRGMLREETRGRGHVVSSAEVLRFTHLERGTYDYPEPERFTPDRDWMSNVVMIAKLTHVWLSQLCRKYGRSIQRLDEIPDEELDQLARWGFTGLWLIGVWERSPASAKIKKVMGNPEAIASAYSLFDYEIAQDLGGEPAYENLRDRAWARGIRLASDMVPNHTGIYSRWMLEHPDWFLQVDHPPFPGYRFTGIDLSHDPRVGLFLEDGYWSHRDAAVVFKRLDRWTGEERYIYHGNDGTHLPWNDTAQLNYLLPEVREAVIRKIISVARKFNIIRFDAAMTLAKKHYQRLWFPLPGEGGAIPSRSEHAMTRQEFDSRIPEEFWREVVERISREAPDTLLLAEAFWLMEGYFVRTLGMHRVYNSAFMNMLKMEDNQDYRATIKNVLDFSPEILKRFVNFMNNPDEKTAVEQFGRGDKYFGVAVLMVTMPGLPMFGHGQIEGLTEKYGMEYRRAYWDEETDWGMVRRHEEEIFPLMRRRSLFSEVGNFAFFDFETPGGGVDENVYAYSNRAGADRALVVFNNAYNHTRGWVRMSVPTNRGSGEEKQLERLSLGQALDINPDKNIYYLFRDHHSRRQFIRSGRQICIDGLYAELEAYQYYVFLDFQEVSDVDGAWAALAKKLNGAGVPDIHKSYRAIVLGPMLESIQRLLDGQWVRSLTVEHYASGKKLSTETKKEKVRKQVEYALDDLFETGRRMDLKVGSLHALSNSTFKRLESILEWKDFLKKHKAPTEMLEWFEEQFGAKSEGVCQKNLGIAVCWALVEPLQALFMADQARQKDAVSRGDWMEEWLVSDVLSHCLTESGLDSSEAYQAVQWIRAMIAYRSAVFSGTAETAAHGLLSLFEDPRIADNLNVNQYEAVLWFNKEQYERMIGWFWVAMGVDLFAPEKDAGKREKSVSPLDSLYLQYRLLIEAAEKAGYQVEKTIELLRPAQEVLKEEGEKPPVKKTARKKKAAGKKSSARKAGGAGKFPGSEKKAAKKSRKTASRKNQRNKKEK